ncbi:MAG TPA: chemotaxis protein CheB, partial [Terriglobales bacterium]|nr:chemotaxis protein CheB [Terriglobales bacterium]
MPRKTRKKAAPNKSSAAKREAAKTVVATAARANYPIVAVGGSAGGFEAFSKLLKAVPAEPNLALIFIPHLDPTHESAMVELLSRSARFPVVQAASGIRVAINTLYVLPPNSDLTISKGILYLGQREAVRGQHMPIDTFFRSLAEDQTLNAVGVILSGTATDGTLGLAAIKNEGGITFAQDPQSAKYDGMPNSA